MKAGIRWFAVVAALGTGSVLAWLQRTPDSDNRITDPIVLGRQVYIAEGCIHCHSQYVRPVGLDTAIWGPQTDMEAALSQEPVLIGNRRQGPDLSNVGQRRDPVWNRMHLIDPRSVTPGSRMPSYRHLFEGDGRRGEALLSYLSQLKPD